MGFLPHLHRTSHADLHDHATPTPDQTMPNAGVPHGDSLSQLESPYHNSDSCIPKDAALMMPYLPSPQHNFHYTTLNPHAPSQNFENPQSSHILPTTRDFSNGLYYPPQPYGSMNNLLGTGHPQGYSNFLNALPNASWPISEQGNRSTIHSGISPAQHFEFRQFKGDYDNPEPRLIQDSRMMVPSLAAQSRVAPVMAFSQSLDESPSPWRANSANMTDQDDNQVRHAPNVAIAVSNPAARLCNSLLRKRKWGDELHGSTKRLRNDQGEQSIYFSANSENDVHSRRSTAKRLPPHHYRLDAMSAHSGRSAVHSGPSSEPGLAKGVCPESAHGFFTNSSNFVIKRPFMMDNSQHHTIDNSQHHHTQADQPDGTLLWLKEYVMQGAEFDSSARDPPPRCHPNTRASLIERTVNWIKDPGREKKMRWVRGHAGVGKSAIVQTVFETIPEEVRGGSVFFSRPNGRDNPKEVFPSVAYQLGVRDLAYRAYLKELMLKDPQSLKKSMKEQFRILFEEPFANRKLRNGQNTLLIVLDGLDECGDDPTRNDVHVSRSRGKSSEAAQREIVELVSDLIQHHPSVPLIWIIASRPEKHLKVTFGDEQVESISSVEEIPVDSQEACKDVERYLNSEFTRIRKENSDLITTTPWPSNRDFSLIAAKASGLFIFAEVVIRFIDNSNPIQHLKHALATISKVSASKIKASPLVLLDAMYIEIVSRVPPDLLVSAKKIIGAIVVLDQAKVLKSEGTLPLICNILDISQDVALTALRHLHSVLLFPRGDMIELTRPRFYHASFRDFLEDESRSHEFSVKQYEICDNLFEGLMRFSGKEPLNDNLLSWPRSGDSHRLAEMTKKETLLCFEARIFSARFPVSKTLVLPYLLNHDFADQDEASVLHCISHMEEKRLQIHERLGVASRQSIDSLGITSDAVSKCKIIKSSLTNILGLHFVVLDEYHSSSGDGTELVRDVLCHWVEAEPRRLARVWGREQFERSVVVDLDLYGTVAFIGF